MRAQAKLTNNGVDNDNNDNNNNDNNNNNNNNNNKPPHTYTGTYAKS